MNILFLTNYPAPYKVDFFNELGKMCNLTVAFEETPEQQKHRELSWFHTNYDNFEPIFLKQLSLHGKTFCPGIRDLVSKDFEFIVVGVYSTLSEMYAVRYMKRHKIKYIIATDGGYIKNESILAKKIKQYFISGAEKWISPSALSDEYLCYYGADSKKVYRYPFTSLVSENVLQDPVPQEKKKELKCFLQMKEDKIVLGIGQFIHRKGWDVLLQAARKLDRNIGIYIVGGTPNSEYTDFVRDNTLSNVHFLSFMEQDKLSMYYKAADVFCLPTREDIWGLVINEAMSYGLPVVTTDKCVAGLELVQEDNGKVVHTDDVDALTCALNNIIKDETSRYLMAEKSIEKIKGYTIEEMARVYYEIFSSR